MAAVAATTTTTAAALSLVSGRAGPVGAEESRATEMRGVPGGAADRAGGGTALPPPAPPFPSLAGGQAGLLPPLRPRPLQEVRPDGPPSQPGRFRSQAAPSG